MPAESFVPDAAAEPWSSTRAKVIRDAIGIGLATGAYAVPFGAIAIATGFSVVQATALSLLMFTGASQLALVGVIGSGGGAVAAAATAALVGSRNALYALRLSPLLGVRGWRRITTAHLVIDESTAMAIGRDTPRAARLGFYATGLSVFVFWNMGTLVGALGASVLSDPRALGLDAAIPAAFLALLWPRLRLGEPAMVALAAAGVALISVPFVPAGIPVLLAALVAVGAGARLPADPGATRAGRGGGA